jgi:hypothetical protein
MWEPPVGCRRDAGDLEQAGRDRDGIRLWQDAIAVPDEVS